MKKEFFCLFDSVPKLLAPLFDSCDTPWELLSRLSDYLIEITKNPPKGYSLLKNSGGSSTSPSCGGSISACPRHSGIMIGEGVRIEDYVTILPPAVICSGAEIRQGAYLRGAVFLGEGAIAGHGTEMKNTVLMDGAKAPHLSYLGDSILGKNAHLGAGVILSNLRLDKGEIFVNLSALESPENAASEPHKKIPTGRRKLGSIIGDGAEIACGTVLNPGTIIPKNSMIFPR